MPYEWPLDREPLAIPEGLPSIGKATIILLSTNGVTNAADVIRSGSDGYERIPSVGPAKWAVLQQWARGERETAFERVAAERDSAQWNLIFLTAEGLVRRWSEDTDFYWEAPAYVLVDLFAWIHFEGHLDLLPDDLKERYDRFVDQVEAAFEKRSKLIDKELLYQRLRQQILNGVVLGAVLAGILAGGFLLLIWVNG